jgi:hypothetical protein
MLIPERVTCCTPAVTFWTAKVLFRDISKLTIDEITINVIARANTSSVTVKPPENLDDRRKQSIFGREDIEIFSLIIHFHD